jgi:hypothetical protein
MGGRVAKARRPKTHPIVCNSDGNEWLTDPTCANAWANQSTSQLRPAGSPLGNVGHAVVTQA